MGKQAYEFVGIDANVDATTQAWYRLQHDVCTYMFFVFNLFVLGQAI